MKQFLFLAALAALCLFALPALSASKPGPDQMKMDHYVSDKNDLVVLFNHSTHKAVDCKECHHTWSGSGDPQKCSSAGCHDVFDKADKSAKSYYRIIHAPKASLSTCYSCHTQSAGEDKDKKKQLTGCRGSACHP